MARIAYLYLAFVGAPEALAILRVLSAHGFHVTRIGKNDPPAKRATTLEAAAQFVATSTDGVSTNYTFLEDPASGIGVTFELRSDPSWGFSTVSVGYPESLPALQLCEELNRQVHPFACLSGRVGAGKSQAWEVSLVSAECPAFIRERIGGT